MKSKLKIVKSIGELKKPAKAEVSEKEFRRKLKDIDKWRKERLTEIRSENPR